MTMYGFTRGNFSVHLFQMYQSFMQKPSSSIHIVLHVSKPVSVCRLRHSIVGRIHVNRSKLQAVIFMARRLAFLGVFQFDL